MSRTWAEITVWFIVMVALCTDPVPAPAAQVFVVPTPVFVPVAQADHRIDLLQARTEYLHTVVANLCKPDGFGARVHPPDPPPGWPALRADREGQ